MSAPTTDLPTVEDFLDDASARLDRIAGHLAPGSDLYELWRTQALAVAATTMFCSRARRGAHPGTRGRGTADAQPAAQPHRHGGPAVNHHDPESDRDWATAALQFLADHLAARHGDTETVTNSRRLRLADALGDNRHDNPETERTAP